MFRLKHEILHKLKLIEMHHKWPLRSIDPSPFIKPWIRPTYYVIYVLILNYKHLFYQFVLLCAQMKFISKFMHIEAHKTALSVDFTQEPGKSNRGGGHVLNNYFSLNNYS